MVSTDAIARPSHVLAVATEPRLSSDGHQEGSQQSSFGVLGMDPQRHDSAWRLPWLRKWGIVAILMSVGFLVIILVALSVSRDADSKALADITRVHRVAFSSCTQRHVGENAIWTKAIIPAAPDAWIWLGDLAYMDIPVVDCYSKENRQHPDCQCEPTLLQHPPHGCKSGDVQNARRKTEAIVRSRGYAQFLEFMCPMHTSRTAAFPPQGSDRTICPRPIFGVYDDHDSGWNDGNGYQLRAKADIKQVFLDALGEPIESVRRHVTRGIHDWQVLNAGTPFEVDLLLLDERYERVPLPCHTRARLCAEGGSAISTNRQVWCNDFLGAGNISRPGSCCHQDDDIALGWCAQPDAASDPHYASACMPWHPEFGTINWAVAEDGSLQEADPSHWRDVTHESGFCEVLGRKQRQWLNDTIERGTAAVTLVASGSVLLGRPGAANSADDSPPFSSVCSGDDWDCYRPAQQNLLAMLARKPGCVIVLTGDYHMADIKRILPGEDAPYQAVYTPPGLQKPIYQVMASGMDPSTAAGLGKPACGQPCCGFQRDEAGLRGPGNTCSIFGDPNFGTIDLDWHKRRIHVSIMNGDGSGVAVGANKKELKMSIDMDTCEPV
eukprot:jgi/Ulvmu1/5580/UM023_0117.1